MLLQNKYEDLGVICNSYVLLLKTHIVFSRQSDMPYSLNQVDIESPNA